MPKFNSTQLQITNSVTGSSTGIPTAQAVQGAINNYVPTLVAQYVQSNPTLKGPTGTSGIQGIQGIQGLQGIQGPTGTSGIQGPTGTSATLADLSGTAMTLGGTAVVGVAITAPRSDHKHAITNPSIESLAAATDVTTLNSSTTAHGLVVKVVAPAANALNVVGVANAETAFTNKTILTTTVPSTQAFGDSAAAGTNLDAAHSDHKHTMPAAEKDKTAQNGILKGNGSTIGIGTDGTDFYSSSRGIPGANIPNGIFTVNTAIQSQVVVAGTYYYITGSGLVLPAASKTGGGMLTSTAFEWVFQQSKTAAGTAAYSICIYRGINGSISDTRDVTQSLGTSTAAVDICSFVVTLKVTATGATGSYTWGITALHKAATATGFGVTDATPFFTGTVSSVAMNTASLIFGLGFMNTTGTPTILTAGCVGQAYNMD